jgi:hypothetical protein
MNSKWLFGNWTGAWGNINSEANCMCRHNYVAVQHCRVYSVSRYRLQRNVCGETGLFDCIQDAAFAANCAILRQTSAGLAHEPHGRVRDALA